jgi:hypothetical protein
VFIPILFVLGLAGCESVVGLVGATDPPERLIFSDVARFDALLSSAEAYESLPDCSTTVTAGCSDVALQTRLREQAVITDVVVDTAEGIARSATATVATKDVAAIDIDNAVNDFEAIVNEISG